MIEKGLPTCQAVSLHATREPDRSPGSDKPGYVALGVITGVPGEAQLVLVAVGALVQQPNVCYTCVPMCPIVCGTILLFLALARRLARRVRSGISRFERKAAYAL